MVKKHHPVWVYWLFHNYKKLNQNLAFKKVPNRLHELRHHEIIFYISFPVSFKWFDHSWPVLHKENVQYMMHWKQWEGKRERNQNNAVVQRIWRGGANHAGAWNLISIGLHNQWECWDDCKTRCWTMSNYWFWGSGLLLWFTHISTSINGNKSIA